MHKFGRLTIVIASVALFVVCLTRDGFYIEGDTVVVSEAPTFAKVTGFGWGYWLWIASMIVITAASVLAPLGLVRDARAVKTKGPADADRA